MRGESRRTQDISKLVLTILESARSAAGEKIDSTIPSMSFTSIEQHVQTSSIYPKEMSVKSNVLAYHLKKLLGKGLIQQIKPEMLPNPEAGGLKQYSFYAITDQGKRALEGMPSINLKEITDKIDNWKRNTIGRLIRVESGATEIANALEKLSECMKKLFVTEQDADDAAIELWTALERLRTGPQLESAARFDHYYEILSEELDQMGQETDAEGNPEFAEDIILLLKQSIEEQEENFREYLQTFNMQPVLSEMGEMLRRMLVSLQSAQVKLSNEKETKRSIFRRSKEEEIPWKLVGDLLTNVYREVRQFVKPTNKDEERHLIEEAFFGMIFPTPNPLDKNVLMIKYLKQLRACVGGRSPQDEEG